MQNSAQIDEIRPLTDEDLDMISGGIWPYIAGIAVGLVANFLYDTAKSGAKHFVANHRADPDWAPPPIY